MSAVQDVARTLRYSAEEIQSQHADLYRFFLALATQILYAFRYIILATVEEPLCTLYLIRKPRSIQVGLGMCAIVL